jgi:hypothetical protein
MKSLIVFIFISFPNFSWAIEASMQPQGPGKVLVAVKGVEVPRELIQNHLKSGLHSRFEFELAAKDKAGLIFKTNQTWKIYFDLWDEVYRLTVEPGETKTQYKTISELFQALENPQFPLVELNERKPGPRGDGELSFRVTLNPVSQETVERMKKWINQRRVPGSPEVGSSSPKSTLSESATPRMGGLFNEILGREMNEAQNGSIWSYEGAAKL